MSGDSLTCVLLSEREEVAPVGVLRLANSRGDRQNARGRRTTQEAQAGLVRESVGLEGVDLPLRPHEVLERVSSTAICFLISAASEP